MCSKSLDLLLQNRCPPILLLFLFQKISQPSSKGQQNVKRKYCRLPPWSFRINLKDTSSHISYRPSIEGFIFIEFSLKFLYPTKLRENLRIYGAQIAEKCIYESKEFNFNILFMADRGKLLIPSGNGFSKIYSP